MKHTITVKYFAGLREKLGKNEEVLTVDGSRSVADIWRQVGGGVASPSKEVLMTINQMYAKPEATVADGDEVAFFPPVTGG